MKKQKRKNSLTLATIFAAAFVGVFSAPTYAAGDPERGEELYTKCIGCHQVGEGAVNRIGPQLNGIFDRPAGTIEGFRYSNGMKRASADGLVWTLEKLDAFIEDPRILVSRTRMSFRGMKDGQDRTDLLAYLQQFSDNPSDIPEATPRVVGADHELDPAVLAIVGDPAYGEYLSGECAGCHQNSGASDGIPAITRWPVEDFVIALHAYKSGIREHPVMEMMAKRLTDDEIAALAAYYKDLE
ncbi:MAG: c-type cytochrome [Devosiaceae bacterium]|nr:c-type cytochrome [Devosiaceae bacterium]